MVNNLTTDIAPAHQAEIKKRFMESHLNLNPNIKEIYLVGLAKTMSE